MAGSGSISRLTERVRKSLGTLQPSGQGSKPSKRKKKEGEGSRSAGTSSKKNGGIEVSYQPERDGDADPGEVVWAWVPYEDDPSQGKDRPVLVIGWDGPKHAVVPLSSRDRTNGNDGHEWVPVGTGAWDRERRPSFADCSRLIRVAPSDVRREGSALDRGRFDEVVARVKKLHDWGN